jgi:hypothetical protein
VHEKRCKPDREASSETCEEPCPEHLALRSEQAPRMLHCSDDIAAHKRL